MVNKNYIIFDRELRPFFNNSEKIQKYETNKWRSNHWKLINGASESSFYPSLKIKRCVQVLVLKVEVNVQVLVLKVEVNGKEIFSQKKTNYEIQIFNSKIQESFKYHRGKYSTNY